MSMPNVTEIITDSKLLQLEAKTQSLSHPIVEDAKLLVVTDPITYNLADVLLSRIRRAKSQVEAEFSPIIGPIRAGLDKLYSLRRRMDQPFDQAETEIKRKMGEYKTEELRRVREAQQKARAEELRLQAEAIVRAAEETRLRQEAEQAQRRATDAQRLQTSEESKRKAQALAAEAEKVAQAAQEAARRAEQAVEVQQAQPQVQAVKAVGSVARTRTTWKVVDLETLIQAVAEGEVPSSVLTVDGAVMDAYWQGDKGMVEGWPGVEKVEEVVIAGRSKRT